MTDLIPGYRWATEDETERHGLEPIAGAVMIPLTVDSAGTPYTQDEADLAVPDENAEPQRPFHTWPSTTDPDRTATLDVCQRCRVRRFSDDKDTIVRAVSACPLADMAVPGHIRTAGGSGQGNFCTREGQMAPGGHCPDGCDHADHYSNDGHPECEDPPCTCGANPSAPHLREHVKPCPLAENA